MIVLTPLLNCPCTFLATNTVIVKEIKSLWLTKVRINAFLKRSFKSKVSMLCHVLFNVASLNRSYRKGYYAIESVHFLHLKLCIDILRIKYTKSRV
eukprot:UN16186